MGAYPGAGAPNNSSSGPETGKRVLCGWLWRAWSAGQMTNGRAKWDIRLEIDFGQGSFGGMTGLVNWRSRIQDTGKACSPAKDKEFKAFLLSCGDRRVGAAPTGEAPMLALLKAWIAGWNEEAHATATLALANNLPSDGSARQRISNHFNHHTEPTPTE